MSALSEKIVAAAREPGAVHADIARRLRTTTGYVSQTLKRAGIDIVSGRLTADGRGGFRKPSSRTRTSRPCLCCGERFWSEGPHNRMCEPCRNLPTA